MPQEYSNPFSAMVPGNYSNDSGGITGFVNPGQYFAQAEKDALARPFIDRMGQSQQLELQKQQQQMQEFMSPESIEARKSGELWKGTENRSKIEAQPYKTKKEIQEFTDYIETSPYITAEKKAKAIESRRQSEQSPYNEFFSDMARLNPKLKELPEEFRGAAYRQKLDEWKTRNPKLPVLPQMEQYDPQRLDLIEYSDIKRTEQRDKDRVEKMKEDAALKRTQVSAGASVQAAQIGADQRDRAIEASGGSKAEREITRKTEAELKYLGTVQSSLAYMQAPDKKDAKRPNVMTKSEMVDAARTTVRESLDYHSGTESSDSATMRIVVKDKTGKRFTIPKSQLDDAIKQGYTEVK